MWWMFTYVSEMLFHTFFFIMFFFSFHFSFVLCFFGRAVLICTDSIHNALGIPNILILYWLLFFYYYLSFSVVFFSIAVFLLFMIFFSCFIWNALLIEPNEINVQTAKKDRKATEIIYGNFFYGGKNHS